MRLNFAGSISGQAADETTLTATADYVFVTNGKCLTILFNTEKYEHPAYFYALYRSTLNLTQQPTRVPCQWRVDVSLASVSLSEDYLWHKVNTRNFIAAKMLLRIY